MNDQTIEQEIQAKGLTAPRVTQQDIEGNIAGVYYFTASDGIEGPLRMKEAVIRVKATIITPEQTAEQFRDAIAGRVADAAKPTCVVADVPKSLGLLTFCVIVLKNGFTVTGESACASPENFDAEIGRKIARQNAVQKIWPLMGYALKEQLSK